MTTIPQPPHFDEIHPDLSPQARAITYLATYASGAIYVLGPEKNEITQALERLDRVLILDTRPDSPLDLQKPGMIVLDADLNAVATMEQMAHVLEKLEAMATQDVILAWTYVDPRAHEGTRLALETMGRADLKVRHMAGTTVAYTVHKPLGLRRLLC